jgi:ACS family tartrate transporter-like MFS transporter
MPEQEQLTKREATIMQSRFSPELQRRTILKVSWRLLPLIVLCYLINYIDRTNVSVAALTMNKDLGLTATMFGFGAGIFFFGYAFFEVPSNIVLRRVGARLWIARIMITWGVVSALMAAATGPISFLALRFALGVAEAGFFPGMIYYLTEWFPSAVRARAIAILYIAVPASNAIAAVLSGAILGMDGVLGLKGWQWIFIIEATPAVLLAFVVLWLMTDRPAVATWLKPEEREWLESELAAERSRVESAGPMSMLRALVDWRVLVLSSIYLTGVTASYGVVFFLPQIIKDLGLSNFNTALVTAIPYVFGTIGLVLWGYSSDRHKERRWHLIVSTALAAVGLFCAGWLSHSLWAVVAVAVAAIGIYGSRPSFWPMPSLFLTGGAAAVGMALINSIGNLGGYVGPMIVGWIKDSTKSFEMALYFLGACALLSAVITLLATRATDAARALEPAREKR